ncbi:alpha/beta hydrolase family protein [Nonomuraea sp. NPDC050556]|uniref:alpha/beta hydrolase family protein n=1 Tax=Nonomuraea sp. NPDC050556 TaxID=3364369 RepID=UPI0037A37D69
MSTSLITALLVAGSTLVLPAPTGADPVGTVSMHLVDRSRRDPLVRSVRFRELMVSVWYPAQASDRPLAPHMSPKAAADWDEHSAPGLGIKPGAVNWAATATHARSGAPATGRYPVIVFASGDGGPRTLGTALVEDLASRGYVVVTVDHTYEADQVEFPGGRVVRAAPLPAKLTPKVIAALLKKHAKARVADLRYVLDQLPSLGIPMDLTRVGLLGQSIGGAAAAQAAHDDPRVDAAVNLDGGYLGPVARTGVTKPFLQVSSDREPDPSWRTFWAASKGWKRELRFKGAAHGSFTDLQALLPQVRDVPGVRELIGTIDPARSVAAQRAYVGAFFDLHLKARRTPLFDHPDPRFPEVVLRGQKRA